MKLIVVLLILFLNLQKSFGNILAPKGFYELIKVEGDLNQDNKSDLVFVWVSCKVDQCDELDSENPPKILSEVYLGEKSKGKYIRLDQSTGLVCFRCGGVKGSTFVGDLEITKKGIIEVSYEGGSRWAWNHVLKWRIDKSKKLTLIGSTYRNYDTANESESNGIYDSNSKGSLTFVDINYSTKNIDYTFINDKLKEQKAGCRLESKYIAPTFAKFNFTEFEAGNGHCLRRK